MAELTVALDYTSDIDIRMSCPSSHSLFQWQEKKYFSFSTFWPLEFESGAFRLLLFHQTIFAAVQMFNPKIKTQISVIKSIHVSHICDSYLSRDSEFSQWFTPKEVVKSLWKSCNVMLILCVACHVALVMLCFLALLLFCLVTASLVDRSTGREMRWRCLLRLCSGVYTFVLVNRSDSAQIQRCMCVCFYHRPSGNLM